MPPGADKRRQAGHSPGCVATATDPLHAVIEPYRSRLALYERAAVIVCQAFDLLDRYAADQRRAFGRPGQRPFPQARPADSVAGNVVMVQPVVGDEFMHQRQRQRGVGARQQGDMVMAFFCGLAFARIDANEFCAVTLGLLGIAPEVQVAGNRVAAPDDDEF